MSKHLLIQILFPIGVHGNTPGKPWIRAGFPSSDSLLSFLNSPVKKIPQMQPIEDSVVKIFKVLFKDFTLIWLSD